MKYALFTFLLWFSYFNGFTQPEGYKKELIVDHQIAEVVGHVSMPDTTHVLHGTVARIFEFDSTGNTIRKKFFHLLKDVVNSSTEYLLTYDQAGRVVREVKISRREGLTKKDQDFIGMFGENIDTTTTRFFFVDDKLVRREIKNHKKAATTVTLFSYQDTLLVSRQQYDYDRQGEMHPKNHEIRYYYDELNRKIRQEKQPAASDLYSVSEWKYVADTRRLQSEKTYHTFTWNITRSPSGHRTYEPDQDSLGGRIINYFYDENGELEKKVVYSDLADLSQVRTITYDQPNEVSRTRKITENTTGVIMLQDQEDKIYNEKGMLITEKIYLRGKLKYTYEYSINYGKKN